MLRRNNGPTRYEQWAEALNRPLTADHAAYLLRGKCNSNIYRTLFNKLSDYITDAFNAAACAIGFSNGSDADLVFALKRLNAIYRISLFFRKTAWIKHEDKAALTASLKNAALATVAKLQPQAESSPDVLFECMALTRTANGET